MTGSSDTATQVVVGDVVRFRSDLFFEGAVQLRWVAEDPERALRAASNFIFHGPRYHAARRENESDGYVLRDTVSFSTGLVEAFAQGEQRQGNPFSLAIAGYGSGKSHLAVTLSELLTAPRGAIAAQILQNVAAADAAAGQRMVAALKVLEKPVLTVPLDGMANFNLGAELARSIIIKLREAGCDLASVEELSPRFKAAEQFVARNFEIRSADFVEALPGCDTDSVVTRLREHDEATYSAVDDIFERANGARIPVEGRESVQDLIATVTSVYCGSDGPFSGLLILFDEFGRFLEYAAEKPHLAGDSALQQLFQGIQDSAGRAHFLGFIQYDLKAYISRLDRRDLMHLQRYITRFEAAEKSYLSTNLETLFAHLIEKREPSFVKLRIADSDEVVVTHHLLRQALPETERLPVWGELEQFRQVICAGCWPLDPLAVWFITRQQDVVQSRSALNIVKESIERISGRPALTSAGGAASISAADLLLTGMLPELVAAEQARGGTVGETLQAILEERAAQLEVNERQVLAAAAVLLKLRVRLLQREAYERIMALAAGLRSERLTQALQRLSEELGVLEWNDDFGHYELVQDAATRGQFSRLLRGRCSDAAAQAVGTLFSTYARTLCNLRAVDPGFANEHRITTQDWHFEPVFAASAMVADSIALAFRDWRQAADVNEPKGRIIYVYVGVDAEPAHVRESVRLALAAELRKHDVARAPVWVVLLHDADGRLSESLQRWWVLERGLSDQEKERYRRFIIAESERVVSLAQGAAIRALGERFHEVAGIGDAPTGRLSQVGHEVFTHVYPQVVPFPFDGFTTGTGAGTAAKKDCLEIVRALVSAEVDAEWIQSRVVRLRNRASQLLIQAWDVLDRDGNISAEPGNKRIAAVLKAMDQWHLDVPSRSLEETRRALLSAPYGCNVASAALLLGLFIARRRPRRRLLVDGEARQNAVWISEAFKASDLDSRMLARTRVGFIAEDDQARWQHLLEDWRNATRHRQRIQYRRQAKLLEEEGVVPEEYLYQYERLVDEARRASETILIFQRKFEQVELELEKQFDRANSLSALTTCDRLIGLHEEVTSGEWESQEIEEIERLLEVVRERVAEEAPNWIDRAHCRSPQEVAEYRRKMEKAAATCKKLELTPLVERIEQQKMHSIATVEGRFKFHRTLVEARQFSNITTISPVATIAEIENIKVQIDQFVEALEQAKKLLQDSELDEVITQLQRRRREANETITKHRAELQELYEASIDSLDSAHALQAQVAQAREIFAGQRDISDIEDARRQLEKICSDLETWSTVDGSPEEVKAQLTAAIEARCSELDRWCEDDEVEPLWNFQEVYGRFCERYVAALSEQSALWAKSFLPRVEEINVLSLEQCRQKSRVLERDRPLYLAATELRALERASEVLQTRICELEEQQERALAQRWLSQFSGVGERVVELPRPECERLLRRLRERPAFLSTGENEHAERLTTAVERRLDELDVSDILARIRILKPEALQQVAKVIADMAEKV
ncbi:hypothetical protein [Halomonas sp. RA08-2]|uniref:hypothetical protein n=1 Tax=Halomonas sp. RA08-2 TaxID=3440842 RepID=UPI003EE94B82